MIIESYGYLISMISAVHAVKKTFYQKAPFASRAHKGSLFYDKNSYLREKAESENPQLPAIWLQPLRPLGKKVIQIGCDPKADSRSTSWADSTCARS